VGRTGGGRSGRRGGDSATLTLIATAVTDAQARSRAIAAWAVALVVGLGGGLFLAGAIADHPAWRWMFPPLTALAVAALCYGARTVPEPSARARGREAPGSGEP
jgi:predicted MFS family arabinose efflux permease